MKSYLSKLHLSNNTYANIIQFYLIFVVLFYIQLVAGYFLVWHISIRETLNEVDGIIERVTHDLRFSQGKWDTSLYNSDPFTAYPNSSSSYPLYVVTTDGFVIERSKPITGILDTSDFKHLMQFQSGQLITTVTNEHWRVLSKPVVRDGKTYGLIVVALYNPSESELDLEDKKLQENLEKLDSVVTIQDDKMNVDKVDVRHIQYLVSFEVVDTFNKVLVNDGRVPTFIDPSYVHRELLQDGSRIVMDETTQQRYVIDSQPIFDNANNQIAVVVAARTIQPLVNTLQKYLLIGVIGCLVSPLPISLLAAYLFQKSVKSKSHSIHTASIQEKPPTKMSFDKKLSVLHLDEKAIEIAYSSNQYYLCKAIFTSPKKRWEQDELVELMGDMPSPEKFRKVYDAALAINKKTGLKLVTYQDKTYFLNPEFSSLLG